MGDDHFDSTMIVNIVSGQLGCRHTDQSSQSKGASVYLQQYRGETALFRV
jgi:hypothetical protein